MKPSFASFASFVSFVSFVSVACACLGLAGCRGALDVKTAPGFVELDQQGPTYAYRATTPEGVVVAARVVDAVKGDLGFWSRVVTLKLRDESGYALRGTSDVTSRDGVAGRELDFARDEDGKPFDYAVTLYVAPDRDKLYVFEVGGARDAMAQYKAQIAAMTASAKVR